MKLWSVDTPDPRVANEARARQRTLLIRSQPYAAAGNGINAAAILLYMLFTGTHWAPIAWLVALQLFSALQFAAWWRRRRAYRASSRERTASRPPSRRFAIKATIWAGIGGSFWGPFFGACFYFGTPTEQLMIGVIAAGILAGGSAILSSMPSAAAAYIVACNLPFAVAATAIGTPVSLTLAALSIVYMCFLFAQVRNVSRAGVREVALGVRNADLLEEAQAANRSKAEFLAKFSHELRTPLNAIIGFSEAMKIGLYGQLNNPRYTEYAGWVHDSATHLLDLINNILDVAKFEAGKSELREETISVDELVAASVQMVEVDAKAAGVAIVNEVKNGPDVKVDPTAIKQVLINLMANAVKFTELGGSISVVFVKRPDGGIMLTVEDSGVGIPADQIERVLEPFSKVSDVADLNRSGAGLGLPIAKMLAMLHGGDLTISSTLGEGTTVSVSLPATRVLPPKARGPLIDPRRSSIERRRQPNAAAPEVVR